MARRAEQDFLDLVGNNLAGLRDKSGLSQEQVAEKAGIASNSVHRYETGERAMSFEIAVNITKVLGCTPNDLLGGCIDNKQDRDKLIKEVHMMLLKMDIEDLRSVVRIMKGLLATR